jgi:hypothetical protein
VDEALSRARRHTIESTRPGDRGCQSSRLLLGRLDPLFRSAASSTRAETSWTAHRRSCTWRHGSQAASGTRASPSRVRSSERSIRWQRRSSRGARARTAVRGRGIGPGPQRLDPHTLPDAATRRWKKARLLRNQQVAGSNPAVGSIVLVVVGVWRPGLCVTSRPCASEPASSPRGSRRSRGKRFPVQWNNSTRSRSESNS